MDPEVRTPITKVSFIPYTKEEIESMSVLKVTSQRAYDANGTPTRDGFYDPRLGAMDGDDSCPICGQHSWNCPGHFGHLPLTEPVYHPLYVKSLKHLLSCMCTKCYKTRISSSITDQVTDSLRLIARGQLVDTDVMSSYDPEETDIQKSERRQEIEQLIRDMPEIEPNSFTVSLRSELIKDFMSRAGSYRPMCANCKQHSLKVKFDTFRFEFQLIPNDPKEPAQFLPTKQVREWVNAFYENNKVFFGEFYNLTGPDVFFIDDVPVTPSKFRPSSFLNQKINAHPSFSAYREILISDSILSSSIEKNEPVAIRFAGNRLQNAINSLLDSALAKTKNAPNGIRQTLEKKEGVFRKNLMGKRVNFSARSVIAPDPYIATDEIGVPEVFAKTLSYPERVTDLNKERLSQAIENGPAVYPGANFVINCNGTTFRLNEMKESQRRAFAKQVFSPPDGPYPMTVGRHVIDGDYVLINRQPTLHRVSILGMKCKVLPNQKTLRMHYSNCSSFNADFDGDEINLHLPQSELGRAEISNLSLSSIHYTTPTAGNPIRGLIQDNVDSGALLTLKNKFFSIDQYQELVFTAFGGETQLKLDLLPPAICAPVPMWTGKQVLSTVIINVVKPRTPLQLESGSKFTSILMSPNLEETTVRICDGELMHGVVDKAQFGASTYGLVHSMFELYGSDLAGRFLTMLTRLFTFYMQTHGLTCGIDDMVINPAAEEIRHAMIPKTLKAAEEVADDFVKEFGTGTGNTKTQLTKLMRNPAMKERFDHVTKSAMNKIASQVIKDVFPLNLSKGFPDNCLVMMTQSGAKGSIVNVSQIACLLGQQDLEGKRVPFMASGKTLPSFDVMDLSPIAGGFISSRFITGLTPQEYYFHCMAGREGLTDTAVKTANTGYLQRCIIKNIEGLHVSYDGTVRNSDDTIVEFLYGGDGIDPMHSKYLTKFDFMEKNFDAYVSKLDVEELMEKADCDTAMTALESKDRDTLVQTEFSPHKYVGSVSAGFERDLNEYKATQIDQDKLRNIALLNYFRSEVEPGEVVGIIAAQAIGEPATQMTLNTFHLAGYGGANVTLGIPRLREILVVATKSPATPTMSIQLLEDKKSDIDAFVTHFKRVPLKDITLSYEFSEKIAARTEVRRERQINVVLHLDSEKLPVNPAERLLKVTQLRTKFSSQLKKKLNAVFKSAGAKITEKANDETATVATPENKLEEMGADLEKMKSRHTEKNSYDLAPEGEDKQAAAEDQQDPDANDEGVQHSFDEEKNAIHIKFIVQNVSVKLLLETIIEDVLESVMVHEIQGVQRATIDKQRKDGAAVILTEGQNFDSVVERLSVDMSKFYTNDIAVMLEHFGIEAARTAIIREVNAVFDAYGIQVDKRHLHLIADYATSSGRWLGLSRHTMKNCSSPLQQMSFETTTQFLSHSTLHATVDQVKSPSASLSVGNVVGMGTGLCEILVPFE